VRVLAVHIKPRYYAQVVQELQAFGLPNVEICNPTSLYDF
jgi:hypothetical protein